MSLIVYVYTQYMPPGNKPIGQMCFLMPHHPRIQCSCRTGHSKTKHHRTREKDYKNHIWHVIHVSPGFINPRWFNNDGHYNIHFNGPIGMAQWLRKNSGLTPDLKPWASTTSPSAPWPSRKPNPWLLWKAPPSAVPNQRILTWAMFAQESG